MVHWLQHVPFEGLGSVEKSMLEQGHSLSCCRLWAGDTLPPEDSVEALIVMGGPMGIYDYADYPWLTEEKEFLAQVVAREIPVLGICLGAQLLADVLGAKVTANPEKEIGWFPVTATADIPETLTSVFPEKMTVFHWHGDTFSLPDNAVCLYGSSACVNQAFLYKKHVLGLQFHLESTADSAAILIENCRDELVQAPWIMGEEEMLHRENAFQDINACMHRLLEQFFSLK